MGIPPFIPHILCTSRSVALENGHRNSWFTHQTWWCSMFFLYIYQRVYIPIKPILILDFSHEIPKNHQEIPTPIPPQLKPWEACCSSPCFPCIPWRPWPCTSCTSRPAAAWRPMRSWWFASWAQRGAPFATRCWWCRAVSSCCVF